MFALNFLLDNFSHPFLFLISLWQIHNNFIFSLHTVFFTEFSSPSLSVSFPEISKLNLCPAPCHRSSFLLIYSIKKYLTLNFLFCSAVWNIPSLQQPDLKLVITNLYEIVHHLQTLSLTIHYFLLSVMNMLIMNLHRYSVGVPAMVNYTENQSLILFFFLYSLLTKAQKD